MPGSTQAVFLSYASQDAAAARRIAEALRAFGVEVWFDQEELRGGDAWDAKIRRQIRECALFVPLISQHTQERTEGYFRREWKLGVERTHDMADDAAFLLPVVIDDTSDAAARVPDKFREVQWTRLPGGAPSGQFVERIKGMAGKAERPAGPPPPATGAVRPPGAANLRRRFLLPTAAAVALAATSVFLWRSATPATPRAAAPVSAPATEHAKSIAVLPFENMSEDKSANAFFADGMHEDVITSLALIRDLHVTSRTTALQFRDSRKSIREIGRELGVAYILEGSVRRSGNKVRVTGQLIDARTDDHLWAKSYDRDLSDAFAIQTELSREIATALQAAVSPQEERLIQSRPTQNPGAYDLFLKAREIRNTGDLSPSALKDQVLLLRAAVVLDPAFAVAWAELSFAHAVQVLNSYEDSAANAAAAKEAIERAVSLAPDSPQVRRLHADYLYLIQRDYERALAGYESLAQIWPLDASARYGIGNIRRRQGQWAAAEQEYRTARQLDPGLLGPSRQLVNLYRSCRRFSAAIAEQRSLVARKTADFRSRFDLATLSYLATGDTAETDALLQSASAEPQDQAALTAHRRAWARMKGDFEEAARLADKTPSNWDEAVEAAATSFALGRREEAFAYLAVAVREARARTVLEPENPWYWYYLAQMEALLGNRTEALAAAHRAASLLPEERDAFSGPRLRLSIAFVHAWTGDTDGALAEFRHLLRTPATSNSFCNVHLLRRGPWAWPLRDDPRWKALLDDPANNAPLF